MNHFYARFDCHDFKQNVNTIKTDLINPLNKPPIISQDDVLKVFTSLKPNKACGPDGLKGKLLKTFAEQLSFIYTCIFNISLNMHSIPTVWKTSKITPVPKSNSVKQMNDLRPIALTSIPMKCLEKLVLKHILPVCQPFLDPCQFAYKANRSVEDAILYLTNNVYSHLDLPRSYVRTLFIDFSSAFNTIQPHLLIPKLKDMGVSNSLSLWILDFLTYRPQFVSFRSNDSIFTSDTITTNTGAPQGTVLAPVLFSIYTNSCSTLFDNIPIIKYADDTSIQALIQTNDDLTNYKNEINRFVKWCEEHFLLLNVNKTKEIIFDFRVKDNGHDDITINDQQIERVHDYKYLGVLFDDKLDWVKNSDRVQKKINQRLFFMRRLYAFNVDKVLLGLFYESCIVSLFCFCINAWGGNLRANDKNKIDRVIKRCNKLIHSTNHRTFDDWLLLSSQRTLSRILEDKSHPLRSVIKRSPRSGRVLHVTVSTARHLNSFLPYAIRNYKQ